MSASLIRNSIEADVRRVMSERGTGKGTKGKHVQCCVCSKTVRKLRLHIRKSHTHLCPLSCPACPARFVGQNDLNNHQRNGCPRRSQLSYPVTTPGSLIGKHKATCSIIVTVKIFHKKPVTYLKVIKRICDPSNLGNNVLVCSDKARFLHNPIHLLCTQVCDFRDAWFACTNTHT